MCSTRSIWSSDLVRSVSSQSQSSGIGESQTTDGNTEREEQTSKKDIREKVEDVG